MYFFVLVNDYEDQIQKKTQDMDQQVQLVSDLDSEVKRLQVGQGVGNHYWFEIQYCTFSQFP